ncbi:hypothetical protein C1637_16830 [Chryseobacterium lactis]|uniref:Uncharacterized protein n=1 Tax=Chryseobacterium lactis TaxID=1241981 RepID=A0A3G6RMY6_CHRLC|nr:hypothetical protein [Chryseobacterium lactis]AZA84153.1 hypothetical protein EG342_20670 [Chryseobacterium lactis]AZB04539.1 hypothetical protein EG341_11545 [Chryseobacterium lactis]PNW12708.1 hypothetical protein C1637_16830 [Chryseobacterium lactis]
MINYLLPGFILFSTAVSSQVGINTSTPQTTLDVTGVPDDTAKLDGILAPRLTGVQLRAKNYTNAQKGTLIFVTAADTSPSGQTINVSSSGYYFFDGTVWVRIASGITSFDSTDDAFINNPTNSRLELGTNSNGTTTRAAGSEFVIYDNGRVGIGSTNPVSALQITENTLAGSNELRVSSANNASRIVVDRLNPSGNLSSNDELGRFVFNAKIAGGSFPVAGIVAYYRGTGTTNSSSMVFRTSDSNKMIIDDAGRVSLGSTYSNSSAILDLQATDKGFLPPRISLQSVNDGTTISSPAKGLIVYNTNTNTAQMQYGEGLYNNSGTSSSPVWDKLSPQRSSFVLSDILSVVATSPVDQPAAGTVNNTDLGLSQPVVIPANSTAKIIVDYSVPMGTTGTATPAGYFGVRFLKDGTEQPAGSRKFTVPNTGAGSNMVSVSGKFTEQIVNSTASDVTVTYTLNGYTEGTNQNTRFNMWQTSGSNLNWGRANMAVTIFVKK